MKQSKTIIFSLLLLSNLALSYQDVDIDGVDDSIDNCLDTPFDELVDKNGCSKTQKTTKYYGHLTLKIGTDIFTDKYYDDDSSLNLYANYQYNNWDISISNSRSNSNSAYNEDNSYSDNDVYISLGYTFNHPKNIVKLSVGTKLAGDVDDTTQIENISNRYGRWNSSSTSIQTVDESRDDDYFASVNYSYLINTKQNIFAYYSYTLSGDSKSVDYEDYSSFSLGSGYSFTPKWYSALSYNYTGSIYKDVDASQSIDWFNSYSFTKNIFATAGYSYALDDLSYDNTFSIALGVTF
ncbi:MAG: hypothetical protein GXO60_05650 [Epsilonproteobacteria bacterium]|nr:hypothetical protein [Campylobacterota bacterium]